jgi:uncharacterized protein (TIGR02147 family)
MIQFESPRQLLQKEYTERSQRNPRYSLRAFSKFLGLSHTVVSLVMADKRPLSLKASEIVAERLGLSPIEREKLISYHPYRNRQNQYTVDSESLGHRYQKIDLATFEQISDWTHFAILSLLETKNFKLEDKWIARRLGIPLLRAKIAIECLLKLQFIEKKGKRWVQTGRPLVVENQTSTTATRKFHRQLLEKAIESLENDPISLRDFSSVTMAIDPRLIPLALKRIRKFRRELMHELESSGDPLEVYNLTVQIYPVSKIIEESL